MISYLEQLRHELEDVMDNASMSQLAAAPEGKWSGAQILEHLFLSYKGTNGGLTRCLKQGRPLATRSSLKQRFATLLVVNLGHMPRGVKAPKVTIPGGDMSLEETQRAILPELQQMGMALDDCAGRFGSRTKIMDHPILGPLTVEEWRKLHWVHGRHHARQIRERIGKL
jgi:Protein of unknown function (DUF1569)